MKVVDLRQQNGETATKDVKVYTSVEIEDERECKA